MKKLSKKDWRNISLIIFGIFLFVLSIFFLGYCYGSKTDWISQHFRLPEYLRNNFYNTKDLLPNFSLNLGGGQNIYNLIYYGLFNPLFIISYLFPYISMKNYVIIINLILISASIILIYKWLKTKYNSTSALLGTLIFVTSGCLIYHTHRHIMFIDYMLFQIIALINVEKYFKEGKILNLILSIFIIILISYFFSVGCLFTIVIYGIYNYLKYNPKINLKSFLKEGIKFVGTILIPILLSSFIILPTLYTLLNGRSDTLNALKITDIIIPTINAQTFLYDSYSIGLSCIFIYALIDAFNSKKKEIIFLSSSLIIIIIFPLFNFLLNGGMYISGKSLIPLLPLCILLITNSINNITKNKINKKSLIILILSLTLTLLLNLKFNKLIYLIIDSILLILTLFIYKYKKQNILIFIPYFLVLIIFCLFTNYSDKQVTLKDFKNIEQKNINISNLYDNKIYRTANLNNILENTNNILNKNYYSTTLYTSSSNKDYLNLIRNIFQNEIYNKDYHTITQSSNIFFNMYMGNKYLISDYDLKGYNLQIKDKTNAYINNDVYSLGYSSNKLMSLKEFNSLEYPYTLDALLNYTIIDKAISPVYDNKIEEFNNKLSLSNKDFNYKLENGHYKFYVNKTKKLNINLDKPTNKILILTFKMNYKEACSVANPSITINNITNTLSCKSWKYYNHNETFHYVISSNEPLNKLSIEITKGHYDISDIKLYEYNYDNLKSLKNTHDEYEITKVTNDKINGNINVTNDGYFQISIPYDKGFKIYVDNKEILYEKINTSFIGFPISKGYHNIQITYEAPFSKIGNIISIITLIGTTLFLGIRYKLKRG